MDTTNTILKTLESTGIDLINWTKESAIALFNFVETEAPLLLQEWVAWHFWSTLILFIIGVSLFLSSSWILVRSFKPYVLFEENSDGVKEKVRTYDNKWQYWSYNNEPLIAITIIYLIISFITGIGMWASNLAWIKIAVAERVWILENIIKLINTGSGGGQ